MTVQQSVQEDKVPMVIHAGVSFYRTLTLYEDDGVTPKNLTGFSYHCQLRSEPGGKLLATMTITTTPAQGVVEMSLTDAQTKALGEAAAVYDVIEKEDATGKTYRLFGGPATITPTVTEV